MPTLEQKADITVIGWALEIMKQHLNGPELTPEQAERRVRNAVMLAGALVSLYPALAGAKPGDSETKQ